MYPNEQEREMRLRAIEDAMCDNALRRHGASDAQEARLRLLMDRLILEASILRDIDKLQKMITEEDLP